MPTTSIPLISAEDTEHWKEKGYVVVKGLLDPDLVKECVDFMTQKYPDPDHACKDFGSNGELEFPCGKIIDQLSIAESVIDSVKHLLNTDEILLLQSDAWAKAGIEQRDKYNNQNQRMHMDYGNNTFLHPSPWYSPDCVAAIIYLSNTKETGGPTAVAGRLGPDDEAYKPPFIQMPGYGGLDFVNDRECAEEYMRSKNPKFADLRQKLYEREVYAHAEPGDILFYRLDIWHRGTPVNLGKVRYVVNLLWRRRDRYWINNWNPGFTRWMYYGWVEKLITEMSPKQRATINIPPVGDPYWNEETIAHFQARYPLLNVTPYLEGLKK